MSWDDEFAVSGPTHMMVKSGRAPYPTKMIDIDWDNHEHRRCVIACLVKGTYVLESDRTKGRNPTCTPLAPAWWESFHFRQVDVLEFQGGNARNWFIHGAVFEYVCPPSSRRHPSAPRYVVAFRGTMPKDPTFLGDARLNLRILVNEQHCNSLFGYARERVRGLVDSLLPGGGGVWLAGHSLGASIALDVGREMMGKRGCNLPTFLFNPPHVSAAPVADMLRMADHAKLDLYGASYRVKDALGKTILRPQMRHMEDLFQKLSPWVPELYVHQRDLICKGFIDYFEQRQELQKRHPNKARTAATLAYRDVLHLSSISGVGNKRERQHLLPTARLWKNTSTDGNAHELRQWWQPGLRLTSNLYRWP